jgi:hypothetical protein
MWMPEGKELQKPPLHILLSQDRKLPRGIQLTSRIFFPKQALGPRQTMGTQSTISNPASHSLIAGSIVSGSMAQSQGVTPGITSPNLLPKFNSTIAFPLINDSKLHNLPCLDLQIWLQKSMRMADFPVQLFADWVRMMPVLAQHVQISTGHCDISMLLKLARDNLIE